jgi:hypothetical protein
LIKKVLTNGWESLNKTALNNVIPYLRKLVFFIFSLLYMMAALAAEGEQNMTLILKSPDFVHLGETPKAFTCKGDDISPALS